MAATEDDDVQMLIPENTENDMHDMEKQHDDFMKTVSCIGIALCSICGFGLILGIGGTIQGSDGLIWSVPGGVLSAGIWTNIFGLICGILNLVFRCKRSKVMVWWNYVASIFSLVCGVVLICTEMATIGIISRKGMHLNYGTIKQAIAEFLIHFIGLGIAVAWLSLVIYNVMIFGQLWKQIEPKNFYQYCMERTNPNIAMMYVPVPVGNTQSQNEGTVVDNRQNFIQVHADPTFSGNMSSDSVINARNSASEPTVPTGSLI